jgi:hypothetical protein
MKSPKALSIAVACILLCSGCASVKLQSGSVEPLLGSKSLSIEYDYQGMQVFEFVNGEDFVNKKVSELNVQESGKGDRWKEGWIRDRVTRYQPKFEEELRRGLASKRVDLHVDSNLQSKYTLLVKTTYTKVWHKLATIRVEAIVCETQNRANPVVVISIEETYHDAWGNVHDDGYRLQTTYGMAGKDLGAYLGKKLR